MTSLMMLSQERSGTTLLNSYLRCSPQVFMHGELLNAERIVSDPLACVSDAVERSAQRSVKSVVGFKVFLTHLRHRKLSVAEILLVLRAPLVLLVYRKSLLENFVSLKIAQRTSCWYSETAPQKVEQVIVDADEFWRFCAETHNDWKEQLQYLSPQSLVHIVEFEELIASPQIVMDGVFAFIGVPSVPVETEMIRQNPASIGEKVENFEELSPSAVSATLDVRGLYGCQRESVQWRCFPDPEPKSSSVPLRYHVCTPVTSQAARSAAKQQIDENELSGHGSGTRTLTAALTTYFGVPSAVSCTSGFAALVLALQCGCVGAGDAVLVPSYTMMAVANAVDHVGATPYFVDSAVGELNPSVEQISAACDAAFASGLRVRAVIITYTYGTPMDSHGVRHVCDARGLLLIEDIAEAIGLRVADGSGSAQLAGTVGDYGCSSLYVNKLICAGEGGFVVSKHAHAAGRLNMLINHGFTPGYHFVHFRACGNYKLSCINSAFAATLLLGIDELIKRRVAIAAAYRQHLAPLQLEGAIEFVTEDEYCWMFVIKLVRGERQALRAWLREKGIETRDGFFPLHLQPPYAAKWRAALPNSEEMSRRLMYMPTYDMLEPSDIEQIAGAITGWYAAMTTASNPSLGDR